MSKFQKLVLVGISALLLIIPVYGQEPSMDQAVKEQVVEGEASSKQGSGEQTVKEQVSKEQIKGLDEQVQEIKSEVLVIAAELNRLEEKLLYPSDTHLAIFVSVAEGEKFRLDAVEIELDGKPAAHHLYTYKELEALQKGGVQRIYVGNVKAGQHSLQVTVDGKSVGGSDFKKGESFTITKGIGPKLVGVVLADSGIGSKTITVKDW